MGHQQRGPLLPVRHAAAGRARVSGGDVPGGQASAALCHPEAAPAPAPGRHECAGAVPGVMVWVCKYGIWRETIRW